MKAQRISQQKLSRIKTQMQAHKTFNGKVLKNTPLKMFKIEEKKYGKLVWGILGVCLFVYLEENHPCLSLSFPILPLSTPSK